MERLSLTEIDMLASLLSEVEGVTEFIKYRGTDAAEAKTMAEHLHSVFTEEFEKRMRERVAQIKNGEAMHKVRGPNWSPPLPDDFDEEPPKTEIKE
jgi:hypothetical protein